MKIKIIKVEQLDAYCQLWMERQGDEHRGMYLAKDDDLYIAVDSTEGYDSDPYWQEEFESFIEALDWLKSASE